MSRIKDHIISQIETIAADTGYDFEFIQDQVFALFEDGQLMDDAIAEVRAIAEEHDY